MKLTVIIFSLIFILAQTKFLTQKKLWVYWNGDIQKAPPFYRVCYQKLKDTSAKQGWNFTLVKYQNLHQYVNNYSQFQQTIKNGKLNTSQGIGDYIKLLLIGDNGGVYVDITAVFFQGFNWMLDLQNQPSHITNYKAGQQPDAIVFYTTISQYRTEQYYPGQGIKNYMPGYGLFFLAGRKNAPIIKLWKEQFISLYTKTFKQGQRVFMDNDIYLRNLDHDYYLTIDKALQQPIAIYQQQIDKNLSLFQQRPNAHQQYKVWGLHNQNGPLVFPIHIKNFSHIYLYTIEEIKKQFDVKYVVKFNGGGANINPYLKIQQQFRQKYQDFQTFLRGKPTFYQCQYYKFFVQGSILGDLIENNQVAQNMKVFPITIKQSNAWASYCSSLGAFQKDITLNYMQQWLIDEMLYSYKTFGSQTYVFKLNEDKSMTLGDKISYVLYECRFLAYLYFIILVILSTVILLVSFFKFIISIGLKRLSSIGSEQQIKDKQIQNLKENSKISLSKTILIKLIVIMNLPLCLMLYFYIEVFGGVHKQFYILVVLCLFLLVRKLIFLNKVYSDVKLFGIHLQIIYYLTLSINLFCLTKSILYSIHNREQYITPITIVISLIFPQILRIAQNLTSTKQKYRKVNNILKKICEMSQLIIQVFVIQFLISVLLIPNLKFIRNQNGKIIRFLEYFVFACMAFIYGLVAYELARGLFEYFKNLIGQIKQGKLNLTKSHYHSDAIKNTFVFIIMTVFGCKCIQIHNSFFSWINSYQKVFLDMFLLTVFTIINISHCNILKSPTVQQTSNIKSLTEFVQVSNQIQLPGQAQQKYMQGNQNEIQLKSFNQESQVLSSQGLDLLDKFFLVLNTWKYQIWYLLLVYLIPVAFINMRWIYKGVENEYKCLDYIPMELMIIVINCACVLVWKANEKNLGNKSIKN